MSFFSLLLSELINRGWKLMFLDSITKSWIIKKWKTIHHISNKAFWLHTNSQSQFCQNKYLSYQLLQFYKYRIPNSKWIIPTSSSLASPEYWINATRKWLSKNSWPRIIKPNNKSLWRWVQKLESISDFKKRVNNHNTEISGGKIDSRIVQEFIWGKDIRVIVINGNIISCYERVGWKIIGDGIHTIEQHIDILWLNPALEKEIYDYLDRHNQKRGHIPLMWESIILHDAKNIALWWTALPFYYTISDQKWINQLSKNIGISYFGLDIITNGSLQEWTILEINSLPSFEWAIIIDSTFEEKFAFEVAHSIDKLYY